MSREEILKALEVIKKTCEENKCIECPLRRIDGTCYIRNKPPEYWRIKAEGEIWRASVLKEECGIEVKL